MKATRLQRMMKRLRPSDQVATAVRRWLDADALKAVVRDGLLSMQLPEREQFIQALETELNCAGSTLRAYLVLLGIAGTTPDELTPNEVGHLIRFLSITVPELMPATERVLSRYRAFPQEINRLLSRRAA